jgi:DNA-binding NtrC family response regulator
VLETATSPAAGESQVLPLPEEGASSTIRMVGQSPPMLIVFEQIRRAASADSTVVISGESGTGKELVAAALHALSPRSSGPFIDVNTAAVPDTLVESELFGHAKGAFTGATTDRIGRFEAAHGGTLFIDEIGDFALTSQAKLLRTLETRRITPVGANRDRQVDVRVIAATNCPLEEMVADGRFRLDLYYRLNVVTIFLPPLRERRSDIPLLIEHFLQFVATRLGRPVPEIDPALDEYLRSHEWPGNVRQLRNCLESMLVLSDSTKLTLDDLPRRLFVPTSKPCQIRIPINMTIDELEQFAIKQALDHFQGDRAKAARTLGLSIRTLQRKLKDWRVGKLSGSR